MKKAVIVVPVAIFALVMSLLDFLKPQSDRYTYRNPSMVEVDDQAKALMMAYHDPEYPGAMVCNTAGTGSMMPTLQGGDITIGIKSPYDQLQEGDIVRYNPQWAAGRINVGGFIVSKDGTTGGQITSDLGDAYLVKDAKGNVRQYKKDEVTVAPVVHRLVQKDKGGWIASGDNNSRSESWERVTADNYVGKVVRIYRVKKQGEKK